MNFLELAEKVIREENKPLSQNEIWEIAKEKAYDRLINTVGKTPWQTIGARLYVDIRDNPDTKFIKIKQKPTRFFLKDLANDIGYNTNAIAELELIQEKKYKERDLHKYLTYFVYNYGFIYTKTIYHEESTKKQYAQWLHPDIVGVYFPLEEWETEILDISKEIGSSGIKLFSYELKKVLNFTNLRESYFQAVSNSSWANEGYLVAASIEDDEEFKQEIKRLNNAFGIGIIKLNIEDPDSSEIIYPAREKDLVDIETMNKIAQVNPNFKEFLRRIKTDVSSREIRKEKYDKIYNIEELAGKL
ncbi:MAG: COG2958 family protein [Rectinema subterraneum]|uniref:COG2958 family protein n=1 Tax=Rectinema subterraneum TaxID=2653714 RepID=UPI003C79CE66